MHVAVLGVGFAAGVGAFVAWLAVMLHHDRAQRLALIAASHERTRSHRRAALTAQHTPVGTRSMVPAVRAGSFCRVPGNVGYAKNGTVLVCESSAKGRPRWRRAEVFRAAS
jgi:hypothetical protein